MKNIVMLLLLLTSIVAVGCDETGGGGGGFIPDGTILAVAERAGNEQAIHVGGLPGSVPPGSTVEVENLDTGQIETTTGEADGSFDPIFTGSTDSLFEVRVLDNEDTSIIGVTLLTDFVGRNLAQLGSVPADILIRDNRAYVINGFSDNIQVFDLNDSPPSEIGKIVLPPGSNPIAMDFVDDTFAYVANNSGQSVAKVNIQTRQCVTLIVKAGVNGETQPCQNVSTVAGNPFEEPSGVAVTNNKVYVSNNNLNEFFSPMGNGFITILNAQTSQVIKSIPATGANSSSMVVDENIIYLLNNGNVLFDFETSEFTCDLSFPPSIDTINTQTDSIINTLNIPLSEENPLVCLPNELMTTPDGRFGYMGLGLVGALLKVDLFTDTVVRGTDDPIWVTGPEDLNNTADIAIRGNQLFTTLFNSDQIAVVNTANDEVDPFPYIAPFPAGIRALNPNSELFDGVQSLAIRPGTPGIDFVGPDIYFITGISEQLGSVDSTLGTQ